MPKSLVALAAGLALMTITPACAQEPLQSQLSGCLAITGLLQRLACYDKVTREAGIAAPARPRSAPQPMTATMAPPPVAYVPQAAPPPGFGGERLPQAVTAAQSQKLVAGVSSLAFDPYGRFTVTLDNGQVWRQLAGDQTFMDHQRITSVEITRGSLNSYVMVVRGRNATYRVSRIK